MLAGIIQLVSSCF